MKTLLLLFLSTTSSLLAAPLKISGSTTVNPPVAEAAEILREEQKLAITLDTQGGSSGGISMLGEGLVQVGMSSKPLTDSDRSRFPRCDFKAARIGEDAVALVVPRDVWEGGVKSLSKEQAAAIYEGRVKNWKELGGPDRRVVFFNKEPGRGTWEVFVHWVYGDSKKAPPVSHLEVGGNEEARSKVASTRGAVAQLSSSWADGRTIFALNLKTPEGEVSPLPETVAAGRWPMSRPLFLLTNGEPAGEAKVLVDFMLGPRGQALVKKHAYLALAELDSTKPPQP